VSRFRYLNGIDWVITGLDRSLRRTAGCGNWSQLVLELDGELDFEAFHSAVQRYASAFPVLYGHAVRGWQLVPVWKMPVCRKRTSVSVEKQILPDDVSFESIVERLGQCVAVAPGAPGRYIGFNMLYAAQKTFLAFRFDHRLFDARGAELFFQGLVGEIRDAGCGMRRRDSECEMDVRSVFPEKAHLCPWIEKFKSGRHIVRMLHQQRNTAAPFHIESPTPNSEPRISHPASRIHPFQFTLIPLSKPESDALINRAYDQAGYLMLTPWLAACMTDALGNVLEAAGRPLGGYVIPCSVDLRADSQEKMFFNHVAFICLCRPAGEGTAEEWPQRFARQFFEQVRGNIPRHFENAWKLARIIPAPLFGKLLGGSLKSFAGTFSMASVGAGLSTVKSVAGTPVLNVFHMPLVPPAPGLGFFANTFAGRLNFCLTSYSGVLSAKEHDELAELLKQKLLPTDSSQHFSAEKFPA
jgi:hypothetical protein